MTDRIAEKTGQGVVCFISNYSWLDGLSFTGMRERYLEAFDAIRNETHQNLRDHLQTFLMAYNFAKRLKTLKGLTSYEFICKCWTEEPKKFRLNPMHHTPGLNS